MTALKLLEELERQIVECGYINANTTLLFKIKDAKKDIEALQSNFTRVEIISAGGRVFCGRCDDNSHYVLSIQDDGKTLKLFEVKDK